MPAFSEFVLYFIVYFQRQFALKLYLPGMPFQGQSPFQGR